MKPQDGTFGQLCQNYWYPLYAFARRCGLSKEEAPTMVQAFFETIAVGDGPAGFNPGRASLRVYMLDSLKHFLVNQQRAAHGRKHDGVVTLALDWEMADARFHGATTAEPSPEKAFDHEWALALLARVIVRLEAECEAEGKGALFGQLKIFLAAGKGEAAHGEVARTLGMEEGAVRVAVHRLRKQYRALLRDEIANTLSDPAMVDEKMRALFGAFA